MGLQANYIVKARIDGDVWTVTDARIQPDRMSCGGRMTRTVGYWVELTAMRRRDGLTLEVTAYDNRTDKHAGERAEAVCVSALKDALSVPEDGQDVRAQSYEVFCHGH